MTTFTDTPDRLQSLLYQGESIEYEKGSLIQATDQEKQTIFLVHEGFVKRYLINGEGSIYVQIIHGPGDIFPLTVILNELTSTRVHKGMETYYYEVMCDSVIYSMDTEKFINSIKEDSSLYEELLELSSKRLYSNMNKLESQALRSAYGKIAHQLVFFARSFGREQEDGIKIEMPFTHQDLADLLSLTRETVSREMVKLRNDGFISVDDDNHVIVQDADELELEAHS